MGGRRHIVQTGSGAMAKGILSDHSPLSSTEVKKARSCISSPLYMFMMRFFMKHMES
jgi:hypothetical protein